MTYTQRRLEEEFNKYCDDNGFNPLRSECTDWWLEEVHQAEQEMLKKVVGEIDSKFSVYYRSVYSQDCSRNETEKEKNTEMIKLSDIKNLLWTIK